MRIKNIFFPWQNWMRQWYLVFASARSNARRRVIHQSKALLLLFLVKWLSRLRDVCPVSNNTIASALYCEKYGENQQITFSRKYRGPRWHISAWEAEGRYLRAIGYLILVCIENAHSTSEMVKYVSTILNCNLYSYSRTRSLLQYTHEIFTDWANFEKAISFS